jgi:D-serine deaminase-like pyridoxal phosphate-dependent protein
MTKAAAGKGRAHARPPGAPRHRGSTVTGATAKAFVLSLLVWATVMSQPAKDRAIIDAGLKALAFDFAANP